MRALRYVSLLLVASCGGFLPFFGGDDDDPPPSVDAGGDAIARDEGGGTAGDASVRDVDIDRFTVVDGGITQCEVPGASCTAQTKCCGINSECRGAKCCSQDEPVLSPSECCSGAWSSCILDGGLQAMCCTPDA